MMDAFELALWARNSSPGDEVMYLRAPNAAGWPVSVAARVLSEKHQLMLFRRPVGEGEHRMFEFMVRRMSPLAWERLRRRV